MSEEEKAEDLLMDMSDTLDRLGSDMRIAASLIREITETIKALENSAAIA